MDVYYGNGKMDVYEERQRGLLDISEGFPFNERFSNHFNFILH
jgi:hypothetical protein